MNTYLKINDDLVEVKGYPAFSSSKDIPERLKVEVEFLIHTIGGEPLTALGPTVMFVTGYAVSARLMEKS